jgi:hypothetical protein
MFKLGEFLHYIVNMVVPENISCLILKVATRCLAN